MPMPTDDALDRALLALAEARAPDGSACPSEVARQLAPEAWRALMPRVRARAFALAADGRLELRQRGRPVSAEGLRGPFRIARPGTG